MQGTEVNYASLVTTFERACALGDTPRCEWAAELTDAHCPPGADGFCAALRAKRERRAADGGTVPAKELHQLMREASRTQRSLSWGQFERWSKRTLTLAACRRTDAGVLAPGAVDAGPL